MKGTSHQSHKTATHHRCIWSQLCSNGPLRISMGICWWNSSALEVQHALHVKQAARLPALRTVSTPRLRAKVWDMYNSGPTPMWADGTATHLRLISECSSKIYAPSDSTLPQSVVLYSVPIVIYSVPIVISHNTQSVVAPHNPIGNVIVHVHNPGKLMVGHYKLATRPLPPLGLRGVK